MLEPLISVLSCTQKGLRLHIWPCKDGFQANVSTDGKSWSVIIDSDPILAAQAALHQRAQGERLSIAAPAVPDDEDLIG